VIIPALNEADGIETTLRSVAAEHTEHEIVVADGGSSDATVRLARGFGRVVSAPKGRARQMNAGAAEAGGDVMLFLHADTLLPKDALAQVRVALDDPSVEGGAFRLQFDTSTSLLRFYSFCTRFPVPRLCFGDRALFVRSRVFESLGGYPDIPIFEDVELVRMLHDRGGFVFLDAYVTTSSRRFLTGGPLRQQLRNAVLWALYVRGTDPHRLAKWYPYTREAG
jgi:rSAM/selenodomain-associated transferase 2